ncbi:MAG TPA: PIG-L family deacetylase [Actinocatenispora sp.]
MSRTVLAIGAHIGDMDLTAGPLLATYALNGDSTAIVALTPGERGHPRVAPDEYKKQKIAEGSAFAAGIGADFHVFDDQSDGFLTASEDLATRVADLIREVRPDVLIAHWPNSIHTDHTHASELAERGRFLAGLPMEHPLPRHGISRFLYAENWEDAEGFAPTLYVPIPDEAFETWREAIGGQAFARGETYGFRYIDYYTALMTTRGCLAGHQRAVALATPGEGRQILDLP